MHSLPRVVCAAFAAGVAIGTSAAVVSGCDRADVVSARPSRVVREAVLVPGQVPAQLVAGAQVAPLRALSGIMQRIEIGDDARGELRVGDTALPENGGALCDEYVVALTAGQPVTIFARGGASRTNAGSAMDMYLYLRLHGRELARDDDSAATNGVLDSRIQFVPPETGLYVVRVSTYGSHLVEGDYWLQVRSGVVEESPPVSGRAPPEAAYGPM